jgi:hypothetical protein
MGARITNGREAAAAFAALASPRLAAHVASLPGTWVRDPEVDGVWGYRENKDRGTKRVSVVMYDDGDDFETGEHLTEGDW